MKKEGELDKFADRTREIVNDTEDIGWGLHYTLSDNYYEFYR